MKIPLEQCFTHTTIFLNGKNLGLNLEPKKLSGLSLEFDDVTSMLTVTYKRRKMFVPLANIAGMLPFEETTEKAEPPKPAPPPPAPFKAQVESPQGHVFEGPGKGRR